MMKRYSLVKGKQIISIFIPLCKEINKMNSYEKILELANNEKGYVTNKMVIDHNFLNNLVLKKELSKINQGVYVQ